MSARAPRFKQSAPAPLYVPSSTDDDISSEDAAYTPQHRYSTLPEDDYISPTKNRSGHYTYGQPTPTHASRPSRTTPSASATRRDNSRATEDASRAPSRVDGGGRFRVRLHCAEGVLDEMAQRHLMAPSVYMALHTAEERGHSRTVHRTYNPEFTDMFDFHSSRPERDALVCTLVALPVTAQGKDRKIAECVISLKNLMLGVEREVWVPMVRHAGTKYAYEQGEVKLSIFSDDFGVDDLPTEEEETAFSIEAQRILRKYAPDELHRLDWIVGEHLMDGDQGLIDIRAQYGPGRPRPSDAAAGQDASASSCSRHGHRRHHRSAPAAPGPHDRVEDPTVAALSRRSRGSAVNRMLALPDAAASREASAAVTDMNSGFTSSLVRLRLTIDEVADLTSVDGGPPVGRSCYLTLRTRANELRSRIHRYQGGVARFNSEAFELSLEDPVGDPIEVTVCAGGRCLGEAQIGLANVEAGRDKKVEIMLVRAADTADATPSGRVRLTLRTSAGKQGYTSPFLWSRSEERQVRDRVLAFLWTHLRDDLHRLDAIVGTVDVPDAYMREWSRTVGREPDVRHLSLLISDASELFDAADNGSHSVFVRATCGPYAARTPTVRVRGKDTAHIQHALDLTVLNPSQDALELMVIESMPNGTDREVARIVLGLKHVPRRDTLRRTAKLITHACSRAAYERGQLTLEMVAQDFGVSARHVPDEAEFVQSCKALSQRSAAEERHRVPYVIDTASSSAEAAALLGPRTVAVADTAAASKVTPAVSAPMTVRVLGLKQFSGLRDGCYVAAVLQDSEAPSTGGSTPLLRTREKKSSRAEVTLDISDDNEATTNFKYSPTAKVVFRLMRARRLRKDQLLAQTEVLVANLICGEANTLWLPLAAASQLQHDGSGGFSQSSEDRGKSASRSAAQRGGGDGYDDEEEDDGSLYEDDKIRDNHLPKSLQRRARESRKANESNGFVIPHTATAASTSSAANGAAAAPGGARSAGDGLLGVELRSNAFPITSIVLLDGAAGVADTDGKRLTPIQAVTRDVTSLVRRYRPEKQGQVQAMIAKCTSLQEAHREIRSEICPRDVEATLYLHIDNIQMEKLSGRQLEAHGEVGIVASFGSECQVTQKRLATANAASAAGSGASTAGQLVYAPIRLDLPGPEQQRVPPLALTLVPLNRGAGAWSITRASDANAPGSGAGGYSTGTGAYGAREAGTTGKSRSRRRHGRSTLGGRNNLMNYFDAEALAASAAVVADNEAVAAEMAGDDRQHTYTNGAGALERGGGSGAAGAVVVTGGLGTVHLSLRALLSAPLHQLGDRVSVPIVCLQPSALTSAAWATRSAQEAPEVVGQLEFHLSAPAFEEFPEWTRLASRSVLAEVDPAYVHYYARRLGAYLRQCAPGELVDFHYGLFERDVASGSWPVSLYDWMLALLKRFRKRESKDFGPEPPLRFNPEEREARRQMESYFVRQSAFDQPKPNSTQRTSAAALDTGSSRPRQGHRKNGNGDDATPEKSRSRGLYADPQADLDPRTEPPRRAAQSKQGSRSRPQMFSF